jgi:hypothetical protein
VIKLKARVENYYIGTGDEIITYPEAELPEPPIPLTPGASYFSGDATDAWLQEHLFGMTGTGRTKGDATYDLTVTESSRPDLVPVGYTYAWGY